ncbi:MAG TPA: tRNA pseudouridine(13) synthase TruD [Steroidobacteraceae bacterium]
MEAESPAIEAWRRIALGAPRAFGAPPVSGVLRVEAADFTVEERLGFGPDGGVAHRLLLVEKQDANTLYVARQLAVRAGCPPGDVGFAGLKDRRAVARQWFSVPEVKGLASFAGFAGDGFRVLSEAPHSRKLRRGALAGNRFRIRVRELQGDPAAVDGRIRHIVSTGVPNYFGAQRFGQEGANLGRVGQWIASGKLPRGREPRAFMLSAARALTFNAVLGTRVATGSWNRLLPGEIVNLSGSRSVFAAEGVDESLLGRCAGGDIGPTGPLCGAGGMVPRGEAERLEKAVLATLEPLPAQLAAVGMRAERRALVLRPKDFTHRTDRGELELAFELPRGAFATSLLREIVEAAIPEPDPD